MVLLYTVFQGTVIVYLVASRKLACGSIQSSTPGTVCYSCSTVHIVTRDVRAPAPVGGRGGPQHGYVLRSVTVGGRGEEGSTTWVR